MIVSEKSNSKKSIEICRWLIFIIIALIINLPIIATILTSFKTTGGIYAWPPQYIPSPFTLKNYIEIISKSPELLLYVLNSFIVGVGCTALCLSFGGLAGFALSRLKMKWRAGLMIFIIDCTL